MQKLFKNLFFILGLALLNFSFVYAQNCEAYLINRKGMELEITNYNKNKQAESKIVHKVVGESVTGGTTTIDVQTETTDLKKNKKLGNSNYQAKCDGGIYKFQFSSFVLANNEQMSSMKDFELKAEGDFIEIPANPQVGQALQGGQLKIKTLINGTENPMLNQTITVSNRKIEALEKVTTSAGTFDCVKISEDVEFKTLFKIQSKSVVWFAKGVGLVKSESYSKKGTLAGTSELTAIKK
jgi:hypothetical protein